MKKLVVEMRPNLGNPKRVEKPEDPSKQSDNMPGDESEYRRNLVLDQLKFIKRIEVVKFLRQSPDEMAAIVEFSYFDQRSSPVDFPFPEWMRLEILDHDKTENRFTVLMSGSRPRNKDGAVMHSRWYTNVVKNGEAEDGVPFVGNEVRDYYVVKVEFNDGIAKTSIMGDPAAIKEFIKQLNESATEYRIVSLSEARFPSESPISVLTGKQKKCLEMAYSLGYYDIPRKINTDQLATRMGLANSTLVAHLRKAEKIIMEVAFGDR